jgi:hypothetical protein
MLAAADYLIKQRATNSTEWRKSHPWIDARRDQVAATHTSSARVEDN